ncbi:hypothetical protein CK489_22140 [Bradyrhizobium sp. UFLA03-84]|uniref:hypothetical protein n=1 Tax=Bradyrhizobium sp. UFLA03-84 TaxID=418599 RepID=UPI000BC5880E|nr:hypothetical protein [Bradyrhizobium sp. UFLA03-84]PAY05672.1 hypothetical protein CK489_22140 [Bradyrhizobium sp. UFLA03-84]
MLFVFLGNLIGGAVLGLRQHCLVLVPVMLAELTLLAVIAGTRLVWSETMLLMITAIVSLQGGYLASALAPLFWSRSSTPLLALRRPH